MMILNDYLDEVIGGAVVRHETRSVKNRAHSARFSFDFDDEQATEKGTEER